MKFQLAFKCCSTNYSPFEACGTFLHIIAHNFNSFQTHCHWWMPCLIFDCFGYAKTLTFPIFYVTGNIENRHVAQFWLTDFINAKCRILAELRWNVHSRPSSSWIHFKVHQDPKLRKLIKIFQSPGNRIWQKFTDWAWLGFSELFKLILLLFSSLKLIQSP